MKTVQLPIALLLAAAAVPAQAQPQAQAQPAAQAPAARPLTQYGEPVTLAHARRIVDAAHAAARGRGFTMAFAIVDPSGSLVLFEKMDGTQNGSIEVALQKARTSALFRRTTRSFFDAVASGRVQSMTVPNVIAIEGGVPIVVGGRVVGAIGVSGGSAQEDGEIAAAALAAAGGAN